MLHTNLADKKWSMMSLAEQLGNIGSEVGRAAKWQNRDQEIFWGAVNRAMELFDLTLRDMRWRGRLIEIGRAKEIFCDAVLGGKEYGTKWPDIEKYFMLFALAARR